MGVTEVARRLDVTRQTVAQWRSRGQMPEPDALLAMGPVWREETIAAWLTHERGDLAPPPLSSLGSKTTRR